MPLPVRIQPIDSIGAVNDAVKPPKSSSSSRLKRLFDRPFRISNAAEKSTAGEFEPSSVCLQKMVQNFIEENNNNEKHSTAKYGRNRCSNCFNGNSNDSSDDELDFFSDSLTANSSFSDPSDTLKSLVQCASKLERNLLADVAKIVDKVNKRRERETVTEELISLGYDASICKSKWEKSPSVPAGEYQYIDVVTENERVIIDVDFRSEFEIARSTSVYKAVLQLLPAIFVGKSDRLLQIVSIAVEAARLSLKKKGMHMAPWRKAEYMKCKWLSAHTRITNKLENDVVTGGIDEGCERVLECEEVGELDLIFGEKTEEPELEKKLPEKEATWQLPAVRLRSLERGNKPPVVTGLAFLLKEKL